MARRALGRPARGRVARWVLALVQACSLVLGGLLTSAPGPVGATYDVSVDFAAPAPITIPASGTSGVASLYPSALTVTHDCTPVTRVRVELLGLSHAYPDDLDILLVGPGGRKVLLMSDVGSGNAIANLDLTFSDSAATALPDATAFASGTYRPTNYGTSDSFPAPAPGGPYASTLAEAFDGIDPDGTWQLFIVDAAGGQTGTLSGGWILMIEGTCNVISTAPNGILNVTFEPAGTEIALPGARAFPPGAVVVLTPHPAAGDVLVDWQVGSVKGKGWASPLSITADADHHAEATFKSAVTFADVPSNRADYAAIVALATRGYILGYNSTTYGPDDGVQRAQMAALIARATPAGPDSPPAMLAPPACTVAGTWDCEAWGNDFTDQNGLAPTLWRNVAALRHYEVAFGYAQADCAAKGLLYPCYAPTAPVSYVETITFITRAMIAKGYWFAQPGAPQPHAGVPAVFNTPVATYRYYTGGIPTAPTNWNAGATRGWFALALWQALDSYWGTDGIMPDGRPTGGYVP